MSQRSYDLEVRYYGREPRRVRMEPKPINVVSCGCCSNGCVCWIHQDAPRGILPKKCELHAPKVAVDGLDRFERMEAFDKKGELEEERDRLWLEKERQRR